MKKKLFEAITVACLMAAAVTGCGSKGTEGGKLKGNLSLAGSTSMEKLCEAMSESFMEANPEVTVTVEYTGSGAGLESLASGSVDIGNASRGLKDDEKANGSVENIVAIDGIAVITDKNNNVTDVSTENLAQIYAGEIDNWSEIGGADQPIVVIGREAGSGTRDAFEELLNVKDECKYAQELDSTGAVLAKVASTPGAIGYVSLDVVDSSVIGLKIDGVEPTEEQILAGDNMKKKAFIENTAKTIFLICAAIAIFAVCAITLYMFIKGIPALKEVGVFDLLFGTLWKPTASNPSYGIWYIILASLVGTSAAILIGVPIGLLTAVFLSEMAGKRIGNLVRSAVELLAAIPSVIYGLIGMMLLNPVMFKLEKIIYAGDSSHQYTGGANMLSAIIVLAIMILPTVISVSTSSLKAVSDNLRAASLALGATKEQTIFKTVIPAAKSGILTGVVLGIGRALGEAMAINMVAGGAVNIPLPFHSLRALTTQIVSEMGYASGLHRQVLFTVGLVLYAFIMIVNYVLLKARKGGMQDGN